jgi:hypothetical protein
LSLAELPDCAGRQNSGDVPPKTDLSIQLISNEFMLGQRRSGNPLLRGQRMVLVDDEAEALEGTECRDPDRVRKHAQHEPHIDGAGSDGLNLRRHFHPLDVLSHVQRSGTRDLDGFFDVVRCRRRNHVTQPEIADFATRGFAGETLGLFEALDGGQGSLLKLLAGKRQLDPLSSFCERKA